MSKLRIEATNTGLGVFACVPIKKGATIVVMTGKVMSAAAVERAIDAKKIRPDDPFQIGEDTFIKLHKLPYTFNHSCEPNAGFRGRRMIALRDIRMGEEIRYDYSVVVCTHCQWSMHCRCGSKMCRKKIGNAATLPKKVQSVYLKDGLFPSFIKRELLAA